MALNPHTVTLIVLGVVNIPVYVLIGKGIFGSWGDFWDAVAFWFTPDLISAFRGEYMDDWWGELKLSFFLIACGVCVYGEYLLIAKYFLG
ncbi:MAG: hypothetical protein QGI81_05085 [Pseudomonadales bacterium]|nr:hypothetical protein [Pseudomonadales bacterium]